ncbi:MAG: hypothetical protein WEA04_01445 [Candidatus Andersenbacteria bacterium]
MTVQELRLALEGLDPELPIVLYNIDAPQMCHIHSPLARIVLQKHEVLDPRSVGRQKGEAGIAWQWRKKVVLFSQQHASYVLSLRSNFTVLKE